MIQEIIKMGNPILRYIAEPVTKEEIGSIELNSLIQDMKDTLESVGGIGLAAPQIGISKQLAIIHVPEDSERYTESEASEEYIIINPKVSFIDHSLQGSWEGCLSVPGLRGYVKRPRKIRVDYIDTNSKNSSLEVEDFLATVFQHELDHLLGHLYVDKIEDTRHLMYEDEMQKIIEKEGALSNLVGGGGGN